MTTTDVHPDQAAVDAALSTPSTVHWITPDDRIGCGSEPLTFSTIATRDFEWIDRADNPCLACVEAAAGRSVEPSPEPPAPRQEPRDWLADRLDMSDLRAAVDAAQHRRTVIRHATATLTYYAAVLWMLTLIATEHPGPIRDEGATGALIGLATLAAIAALMWHAPRNRADQ